MIVDVKTMGAKGDGVTDDTPVLNIILQNAANMYFPHGIYIIKDT
jgi:polygalacturonase